MNNKDSPANVEAKINKIIAEISAITGIPTNVLVPEQDNNKDPLKLIADIRSMLDQVVQEYKAGNYANAENVTITAYLDRFEFVEPAIAMHDIKLMESTEQMLRNDLRNMITGKAPLEQVQQQVDKIKSNLDLAEALISP
jgi:high-affinity iron transporter